MDMESFFTEEDLKDKRILVVGTLYTSEGQVKMKATHIEIVGESTILKRKNEWEKQFEDIIKNKESQRDYRRNNSPVSYQNIALISSEHAQGCIDFINFMKLKNISTVLYETHMQNKNTVSEIIKQIETINEEEKYDLICIVRGGGNWKDLFCYNSPQLAQTIIDSKIDIGTAIGHTDNCLLCDQVADIVFATPTEAAKRIVSDFYSVQKQKKQDKEIALISKKESSSKVDFDKGNNELKIRVGVLENENKFLKIALLGIVVVFLSKFVF